MAAGQASASTHIFMLPRVHQITLNTERTLGRSTARSDTLRPLKRFLAMTTDHPLLDLLTTPIWLLAGDGKDVVFANQAARQLAGTDDLKTLRHGNCSAHAEESLAAYLPALQAREEVIEIWTVQQYGQPQPLSCRLSLLNGADHTRHIVVEGILASLPPALFRPEGEQLREGFYEKFFNENGAPMLLIDPESNGQIVDANLAACRFYGYPRDVFCSKHTWEINALGREVLPIMNEVSKLPGGHKPLNFVHQMADGSLRDVQTYANPVAIEGKRLMLCVIHDVTEQKRLKNELEYAALRDPLTGLWNRRHFLNLLENARLQKRRYDVDYSLLILDADHFKRINDTYGHDKGDEVLILLASTLRERVRETDAVSRWGGEEFTILLPQTTASSALHLAECLRQSVAELTCSGLPGLSISIGVAQHQAEESTEDLLRRADAALYQAKAAGRNRVVLG